MVNYGQKEIMLQQILGSRPPGVYNTVLVRMDTGVLILQHGDRVPGWVRGITHELEDPGTLGLNTIVLDISSLFSITQII